MIRSFVIQKRINKEWQTTDHKSVIDKYSKVLSVVCVSKIFIKLWKCSYFFTQSDGTFPSKLFRMKAWCHKPWLRARSRASYQRGDGLVWPYKHIIWIVVRTGTIYSLSLKSGPTLVKKTIHLNLMCIGSVTCI